MTHHGLSEAFPHCERCIHRCTCDVLGDITRFGWSSLALRDLCDKIKEADGRDTLQHIRNTMKPIVADVCPHYEYKREDQTNGCENRSD